MNCESPEYDFITPRKASFPGWVLLLLLVIVSGFFTMPAFALDTASVKRDVTALKLGSYLEYLEDKTGHITIDDLLAGDHQSYPWKKSMQEIPGFGFTTAPYWFIVEIKNEDTIQNKFLIEIGTSVLDNIETYYVANKSITNVFKVGDHFPFYDREIPHRNFLIPLTLSPGEIVQVYFRVQTSTSLQLPLKLWSENIFHFKDGFNIFSQGLFYGIMLVVILFSWFLYVTVRERQYLYYLLYVLFHSAFQAAAHGLTFQYLWPNAVWWHEKSIVLFGSVAIVFCVLFAIEFLSLRNSKQRHYIFLMAIAGSSAVVAVAILVFPYAIMIQMMLPLSLLMVVGVFFSGITRWREGDKPAQIYTIAWASFLLGIELLSLNRVDIISRNIFTENAMQVGASIEVILLLIALAQRLSLEIKERFRIRDAVLVEHQNANIVLESRVEARTSELANKNKQLETISIKLAKYLSPQIYEQIFQGKWDVLLETRRKKLTIFFSDIKDFTEITDSMESEALTDLLNSYLNEMAEVALSYGGTIDKFIGDGIMIFFGDPESRGDKQDALNCVKMAIEMRRRMVELRGRWLSEGVNRPLQIRIGINTGYCTVGNFGSDNRLDYTIVGGQVNLASRLESSAEQDNILISDTTYALVKDKVTCVQVEDVKAKGFEHSIKTYQVLDTSKNLNGQSNHVQSESNGFILSLDLNVADKEHVTSALEAALDSVSGGKR